MENSYDFIKSDKLEKKIIGRNRTHVICTWKFFEGLIPNLHFKIDPFWHNRHGRPLQDITTKIARVCRNTMDCSMEKLKLGLEKYTVPKHSARPARM